MPPRVVARVGLSHPRQALEGQPLAPGLPLGVGEPQAPAWKAAIAHGALADKVPDQKSEQLAGLFEHENCRYIFGGPVKSHRVLTYACFADQLTFGPQWAQADRALRA